MGRGAKHSKRKIKVEVRRENVFFFFSFSRNLNAFASRFQHVSGDRVLFSGRKVTNLVFRVSPLSPQGAVRWETLGTRLEGHGSLPIAAPKPEGANTPMCNCIEIAILCRITVSILIGRFKVRQRMKTLKSLMRTRHKARLSLSALFFSPLSLPLEDLLQSLLISSRLSQK